nr:MAG TPA: hypothetical protein [Caudoviricetes sp.]
MSLTKYIYGSIVTERLKITSKTKLLIVRPSTKDELRSLIEQQIKKQGPSVNLNFIDTSSITDMSELFYGLGNVIRSIKIDEWDVSNVTNMYATSRTACSHDVMFYGCKSFNADLSEWDVSSV